MTETVAPEFMDERESGAERLSRFRCPACGYGASSRTKPARCPMCGGDRWQNDESRPSGRVLDERNLALRRDGR